MITEICQNQTSLFYTLKWPKAALFEQLDILLTQWTSGFMYPVLLISSHRTMLALSGRLLHLH